jgi:hypothetical protein
MNYSVTIAGIIGAIALPLLGQWGFSEACSHEILGVGLPTILALPGLITAYIGRVRQGDVNVAGFKKHS